MGDMHVRELKIHYFPNPPSSLAKEPRRCSTTTKKLSKKAKKLVLEQETRLRTCPDPRYPQQVDQGGLQHPDRSRGEGDAHPLAAPGWCSASPG